VIPMYIDLDGLKNAAEVIAAIGTILGFVVAVYKFYARQKKQDVEIAAIRAEQQLLCYALRACLSGLKELGCNGPVTDALNRLDKHLNAEAHRE